MGWVQRQRSPSSSFHDSRPFVAAVAARHSRPPAALEQWSQSAHGGAPPILSPAADDRLPAIDARSAIRLLAPQQMADAAGPIMTRRLSIAALPRPPKTCGDQNGPAGFSRATPERRIAQRNVSRAVIICRRRPCDTRLSRWRRLLARWQRLDAYGLGAGTAGGSSWGDGLSAGFPKCACRRCARPAARRPEPNHRRADEPRPRRGYGARSRRQSDHAARRAVAALRTAGTGCAVRRRCWNSAPPSPPRSLTAAWPDASDWLRPLSSNEPRFSAPASYRVPPVSHLELARYWGAATTPAAASEERAADSFYLSPVPHSPSWNSPPTGAAANSATPFPEPPSALSWGSRAGSADSGQWTGGSSGSETIRGPIRRYA